MVDDCLVARFQRGGTTTPLLPLPPQSSKQFQRMQAQLEEMEERLQQREQQLKLLCSQSTFSLESDVIRQLKKSHADELEQWKALVAEKSRDIDHFREQLDQLLHVLKTAKLLSTHKSTFSGSIDHLAF